MNADFVRETQDIEKVDASGESKFNELDRNGTADVASYTAADETIRLRGGEPTVWDSRARTKAAEIDSNNSTRVSYCRGKVQTTMKPGQKNAPRLPQVKSPVYLLADRAELIMTPATRLTGNGGCGRTITSFAADVSSYREQKQMDAREVQRRSIRQSKNGQPIMWAGVRDVGVHALLRCRADGALRNQRRYQAGN